MERALLVVMLGVYVRLLREDLVAFSSARYIVCHRSVANILL